MSHSKSNNKCKRVGRVAQARMTFYGSVTVLLAVRLLSACQNLVHDADETYNYWEPLHYLLHGTGFQTWEYAPRFAIRSWTYLLLHAAPLYPLRHAVSREVQFYVLRALLGCASASTEACLIDVVRRRLDRRVASLLLVALASSVGMYNASTAFLPSSFAMLTSTLGLALGLDGRHFAASLSFAVGALIGWPFSALLAVPVVVDGLSRGAFFGYVRAAIVSAQLLLLSVVVDHHFYRRWTVVPLNIVLYNVFSAHDGRGPDLFGTEPLSYYAKNLVLNLNVWAPLALLGLPVALVSRSRPSIVAVAGPTLWLLVFGTQPHKEERFLYPIYPSLLLSGCLGLHGAVQVLPAVFRRYRLDALARIGVLLLGASASLCRVLDLTWSYNAPLHLFPRLPARNVCMGADWYRFPSSFLLPDGASLSFVPSEFRGLLPGKFSPLGAHVEAAGMNDLNVWSPATVVDARTCDCFVEWRKGLGHGGVPFVDRESGRRVVGEYVNWCRQRSTDADNGLVQQRDTAQAKPAPDTTPSR